MANKIRNANMLIDEILADNEPHGSYTPPEISDAEYRQALDEMYNDFKF